MHPPHDIHIPPIGDYVFRYGVQTRKYLPDVSQQFRTAGDFFRRAVRCLVVIVFATAVGKGGINNTVLTYVVLTSAELNQ